MSILLLGAAIISVLLAVYLLFAMLWPDKLG